VENTEKIYLTSSNIEVKRKKIALNYAAGLDDIVECLNSTRGIYLSSGYEYPGRYSRWDILIIDPPIELNAFKQNFNFKALNKRGAILNKILFPLLQTIPEVKSINLLENNHIQGELKEPLGFFSEEERSKQPSIFSIIRFFIKEFNSPEDSILGLAGAFGYDLIFQFDKINFRLDRPENLKDLRLFFFDEIYIVDRQKETISKFLYDFSSHNLTTSSQNKEIKKVAIRNPEESIEEYVDEATLKSDHKDGEYPAKVEKTKKAMYEGDYFELVLHQKFQINYKGSPLQLFKKVQKINPSPYEFFIQFKDEQLIGTSPEMFVRTEGRQVETCPISGTIKRGDNALEDAAQIHELLNSKKDEAELTMCTDVDRNDKSRVCIPGSVKVIGRRLIEKYAGLFHTVDNVVGTLKEGYDSIDAFLSHMWAVTLTGAPKKAALQAIEDIEESSRRWYGGAIGIIKFNGDINTGITIRTVHLEDGVAHYRVGATLHYDSIPELEQKEVLIKSTSFFAALLKDKTKPKEPIVMSLEKKRKVLFVDNEDSFVHTLANYVRQTGAEVITLRYSFPYSMIDEINPDLIFVSPGPGRPSDFKVSDLILEAKNKRIPLFGVCLGLQGIVEAFGGKLKVLSYPMHGKTSLVSHNKEGIFQGLPENFEVGRYHSLIADPQTLPDCLEITAKSDDGIIMGIKSKDHAIEAVQFHPESILTAKQDCGLLLIKNIISQIP